ncbi:hypothetical protein PV325_003912 [Microctonus aethiopoides]|uniref:Uncharacterized protein n=1 Tax=Microctonus aethiopoides TaxID=144406 RepID=A0AA39FP28_9HYME|nr:hypothetical protein PV325_003912 [Microctonus aethiopoides]KAK0172951.1 hypothetical protein PV328_006210 [Microctonus aethiopoides]
MEEDQELIALKKLRDELIETALTRRDKLSEHLKTQKTKKKNVNITLLNAILNESALPKDEQFIENVAELNKLTQNLVGFTYNNINKKWIRDNVWLYNTDVSMKSLNFNLDLTVDQKNDTNEIIDIMCHFEEVDSSLLQEIYPWVLSSSRAKNFSSLMSAFSEYNEKCVVRKKILSKLVNNKFVTVNKCTKEEGGLIIYIHSPKSLEKFYAEYLWKLKMNLITKSIDHSFTIKCLDQDFMDAHPNLIGDFCKPGLKRDKLENLWNDLCLAIDQYK